MSRPGRGGWPAGSTLLPAKAINGGRVFRRLDSLRKTAPQDNPGFREALRAFFFDSPTGLPQTGLLLHVKASSLALSNGDPVSTWPNEVPNGLPLTGSGATRPTYDTTLGVPAVKFDGAHYLDIPNLGGLEGVTVLIRLRSLTGSNLTGNTNAVTLPGPWSLYHADGSGSAYWGVFTGSNTNTSTLEGAADWRVISATQVAGTTQVDFYFGTSLAADDGNSVAAPTSTTGGTAIVGGYTTSTFLLRAFVSDVVIYRGARTASQIAEIVAAISPSGTTFSQAVGGVITAAGGLIRQTNKRLLSTLAPSGAVSRLTSRVLLGGILAAGSLSKQTSKPGLSGSLAPTGSLSASTVLNALVSGSITAAGNLTKTTLRAVAGSIGMTGALSRLTQKALAGSLTPQGALSRLTAKVVAGQVTLTGTVAAGVSFSRAVAGSITAAGSLAKRTARTVVGSMSPAGLLRRTTLKQVAGSLSPQGALSRLTARLVSGSILPSGGLQLRYTASRALSGAITATGRVGKLTLKQVAGSLSAAGSLASSFIAGGPGPTISRWFNKLVINVRRHRRRR